ncbi:hypothetical protein CXB51_009918 [Gossypium anomalum]|uniref:RNase H type-1 domain-containing protein n=1 Tax=Gossypium anomalum TaxID=47600 RepID=A0A8J5ZMQ2_9ROSI|nr:hypothetical protein CXB51_009918 [Gossypium anomalum]
MKVETGRELSIKVQQYIAELEGLRERASTLTLRRNHRLQESYARVTIQFDAAFDYTNFKSASGLVVWSRSGRLIAMKTVLHRIVLSPFAAEAFAGLQALKLGSEMDFPSVTVMGDSRTIIKKCQAMKKDKSNIGAIINDIHSKMTRFEDIRFQFINRTENAFAHKIVEEALKKEEKHTW